MKDCETWPPIMIERGEGLKLYTADGHWLYDTISSWWCNIHGHNHPRIMEAIRQQTEQLDHVLFAGFTHRGAIELAERLVDLTADPLTRVFYSDNGSTAVEAALKMSLQYWVNIDRPEKQRFVGFDMGYHGDTAGAMSVVGESLFNRAYRPMLFESFKVSTPYCYRCPAGQDSSCCNMACLEPLEQLLKTQGDQIAGMILEPLLLGAAGMVMYPAKVLQRIAELTSHHQVHLILDEVATGFGRTGTMFAYEQAEVTPDFLCISKGITSGTLPIAATLTTEAIFDAFYADYLDYKTLYHGHTFTANPIGCAAALASLDIFAEEKTLEQVQPRIRQLHEGMERFRERPFVGDIRCLGMVAALELVRDRETQVGFDPAQRLGHHIFAAGLEQHLLLRPLGNVIYLYLPLCVTEQELDEILDRSYRVITKTVQGIG